MSIVDGHKTEKPPVVNPSAAVIGNSIITGEATTAGAASVVKKSVVGAPPAPPPAIPDNKVLDVVEFFSQFQGTFLSA